MFSIYTPTNNPQWLKETYDSLLEQTYKNWEWVLVPNGPNADDIAKQIKVITGKDKKVKIYPNKITNSVGYLKHFACLNAKGDYYLELDHDDILAPNCLEEITKVSKGGAEFFYSDWTGFKLDGTYEQYSSDWGWDTYEWKYKDKTMPAIKAFPPLARAISEIYFAPNHIRCWSKEAYNKSGGYDPSLKVADDHDLVCRTYLSGVTFHYIEKPLYLYRIHDTNTVKLFNADIQTQQSINRDKYIYDLVFEECRRNKTRILNLGELDLEKKYTDKLQTASMDYNTFLNYSSLPFEDSSIGVIRCLDFLQLIPTELLKKTMEEFYRILIPGGWLLTATPAISGPKGEAGRGAYQDLRHKSFWSTNNFWYWTEQQFSKHYYTKDEEKVMPKYQAARLFTAYPSEWHGHNYIPYVYADLIAIKDARVPGRKGFTS